jgi:hypothetical protein
MSRSTRGMVDERATDGVVRPIELDCQPHNYTPVVPTVCGQRCGLRCTTQPMARPPRNELAVKSLADAVKSLQLQHKRRRGGRAATSKDIELFGYRNLEMRVSDESIRKALTGQVDPTTCNVELLIVLAAFFEVSPDELGAFAAERVRRIVAFAASGGPDGGGDQASAQSRCTAQSSPGELAIVVPFRWSQPQLQEAA